MHKANEKDTKRLKWIWYYSKWDEKFNFKIKGVVYGKIIRIFKGVLWEHFEFTS